MNFSHPCFVPGVNWIGREFLKLVLFLSATGHKDVSIAFGQRCEVFGNNFLVPEVNYLIRLSYLTFWWCTFTPQNFILCPNVKIDFLNIFFIKRAIFIIDNMTL